MKKKRYQFVNWFPEWRKWGFVRLSKLDTGMQFVYDWILWFGFWELRKWHRVSKDRLKEELDEYNKRLHKRMGWK